MEFILFAIAVGFLGFLFRRRSSSLGDEPDKGREPLITMTVDEAMRLTGDQITRRTQASILRMKDDTAKGWEQLETSQEHHRLDLKKFEDEKQQFAYQRERAMDTIKDAFTMLTFARKDFDLYKVKTQIELLKKEVGHLLMVNQKEYAFRKTELEQLARSGQLQHRENMLRENTRYNEARTVLERIQTLAREVNFRQAAVRKELAVGGLTGALADLSSYRNYYLGYW